MQNQNALQKFEPSEKAARYVDQRADQRSMGAEPSEIDFANAVRRALWGPAAETVQGPS
jgi:hypothetical protein